ncbi:MAG: helix-turn-helix transcriptional regulator [Oscillospiraceae bacterium]|nr:helix-turn-helix transcriptional regulator [Oscillospiraceae bacterium]
MCNTKGWLKVTREKRGLSQNDVSAAVGITQASYSNIEAGKRRPSVPIAKKIAAALGFDWTRFYDDNQDSA